jgi:hypothetical protein
MALLQGTKKLFGSAFSTVDDLDCVSAVNEAIKLQVEACIRGIKVNSGIGSHTPCFSLDSASVNQPARALRGGRGYEQTKAKLSFPR